MCTVRILFPLMISLACTAVFGQAPATAPEPRDPAQNRLKSVQRICIGPFVGDENRAPVAREIAAAAIFAGKRFILTERCENADAVLKGSVLELSENRVRGEGEAAKFGAAAGGASVSGSSGSGGFAAALGGDGESLYSSENRSTATVTLRLVDTQGEVIWAYSQDSPGGKTKNPITDAVERAVRQLLKDVEKPGPEVSSKGPD